jgi:outer membrane protein assembly factor BamB
LISAHDPSGPSSPDSRGSCGRVPNENFYVYAVHRDSGSPLWHYKMPDQTWSLPAVDAASGALFVGNKYLLPILGKNTFGIAPDGSTNWSMVSLGTVAASPLVTPDGKVILGGFDGYARAYSAADGSVLWEAATRDHISSSAARELDGTLVEPSADGTVYDLSPLDGHVVWSFDAGTPIRLSPAIDGDGNVYVGGGDGRLYVLRADGSLRCAMQLIDDPRNDLKSSPALGANAVKLGGESGQTFSVPYDFCLRAENAQDARCITSIPASPDGVDANAPTTFLLAVRQEGAEQLIILDSTNRPDARSSGRREGRRIGRREILDAVAEHAASGRSAFDHTALELPHESVAHGARTEGGQEGGAVDATFSTTVNASSAGEILPSATYEISRPSIPLRTLMAS